MLADVVMRRFRVSWWEVWDVSLGACFLASSLDAYANGCNVQGQNFADREESQYYRDHL